MPDPAPTRIAFVITELSVGGAERCLVNLVLGINRQQFTPQVYSLGPRPTAGRDGLVQRLESAGVPVHFQDAVSARQFFRALKGLRTQLLRQSPDLIQTFLFHANVLGTWAAKALPVTIVGGIRVADPSRLRMVVERRAFRRTENVVCVSNSVAEFARVQLRLPANKLTVIPNGISGHLDTQSSPADLSDLGVPVKAPVILFVGRLEEQKGVEWLLGATPAFLAQLPNHRLVVVGDGRLRNSLQSLAASSAEAQRIHFVGWRPDVPNLLQRSQMLVLPSRWEGMPNVVLEAMAAGRPVVATRADGVEELLGADSGPQVVDFGNDQALVESIRAIATDPPLARSLSDQNRRRARAEFSLDAMVLRYEALYRSLLSKSRPKV
jgi:glycosyltransferase involved in cell wall biosynthesis